jgi:cytochrome P450
MGLPPGPTEHSARQTLEWTLRPSAFLGKNRANYGDVFTAKFGIADPVVVVSDPDLVKRVFTGDANILRAGEGNRILAPVLGSRSVLLLDGAEHLRQRKLLLPQFHGERMTAYIELMRDITNESIDSWPLGSEFPLQPAFQGITLDIILRAVFGVEEGAEAAPLRAALQRLMSWSSQPMSQLAMVREANGKPGPWVIFKPAVEAADALIHQLIAKRRLADDLEERGDVLSLLLLARDEDGEGLTDKELRDEMMTLLLAGHETTATALSWAYERLLRQPDDLEALREESLGEHVDDGWADGVVRESMRRRPPIPMVARRLSQPWTLREEDGELPAGTIIAPSIWLVHHREDIYPEPEAFRPSRWLGVKPDTYRWFPFGGGIRRCIGASFALLEMREVLRTVAARTDLRVADSSSRERIARRSIVLGPRHGTKAILDGRRASAGDRARVPVEA